MASSWPASSSTAKCSRTSPSATPTPSADSPSAPARRRRADRRPTTHNLDGRRSSGRGALFRSAVRMITSAHNEQLKEVRKLHRRQGRKRAGRFVAEGEDLLAAADAAGWAAAERFVAAGSGLDGLEVEPDVLAGGATSLCCTPGGRGGPYMPQAHG